MIAQFFFTALLLAIGLVTFAQLRQIPLVGATILCAALFGGYLVWMPDHATVIAHWIGIGRGTDLILYVWVLISSAILLVLYLNVRAQLAIITVLARAIALSEARASSAKIEEVQ
jgi:small membrane protein